MHLPLPSSVLLAVRTPAPSKRRRVDPNGTGTAIDPVPEHLQHLTRAIAAGDFASAFVHGHNIGADTPAQLPVMSSKELTNAAFSTSQAVHAIVQSVGSFYYDIKVENQQLHSDNLQLRSEVEQLRHERDGMAAAVMQLQSLVSDLHKRTGGNGTIDFAPVPQLALAPQPAPGSTQADTSAAPTAPASPAKSPARSIHSVSPARRASVSMVPNESRMAEDLAKQHQQQVNGSSSGGEQQKQETVESQGDAMDVDPSVESSTNDLSQ
ncbi:hypothetical protein BCR44DRAFT_283027 [Catenaria anguillulae PL171]|uniref:Uncharacterized protein n=1 Tax=Catenaria anguillulae PL171 TaxID=765915 RepID=A0A1Y2HFS1_9FUNG|nr:hypothetical protein BCR44DRAFT_283027 [Catenaria anguillulae PL171]